MSRLFRILASCRSEKTREAIEATLGSLGDARVEYRNGAIADVAGELGGGRRIDLMILDVDLGADSDLVQLTELIEKTPSQLPIIATSSHSSIDRIRLLMRLGLADFVPQPITSADLLNSIQVARRNAVRDGAATHGGAVIAVTRAAGGMGASTFAVGAAEALAGEKGRDRKVCLIDLDIQHGLAGLYLDVSSPVGVIDCVLDPQKLDASLLKSVVTRHEAGFDVLPAPDSPAALDEITARGIEVLLDVARESYDVVIVDMPPAWVDWCDSVIEACDRVVVVTQVTVAALRRTRGLLEALESAGLGESATPVVCNRFEKRLFGKGLGLKDAEKALGRHVRAIVPDEPEVIAEAQNEGVAIGRHKRGGKAEKAIRKLAREMVEEIERSRTGAAATVH